ncbi:MAG: extracellular solute-binding protein [Anaerolineaceae bacterium]|nr:extracellular solute-binding protein [Anaerolineaceae bacterium]
MVKKIVSLLMVIFVMAAAFGCTPAAPTAAPSGGEEPVAPAAPVEEVVTLDYYWIGNGDTDQRESVEQAINEYVEPLIGVNVKFHIIGWGDWASKAVTALQAGEKIDIIFTADWSYYMQEASDGLLTPLNDDNGPDGNLLELYGQDILRTLNPSFITGTQVDGVNYAVPTNKELTVPMGLIYNATIAEEIGLTDEEAAKIKSMEDLEPWLAKAKELYPNDYPYIAEQWWGFEPWLPSLSSSIPGNVINMKMMPDANGVYDETIYSVWETDINKDFAKLMYSWAQKGYIHPDAGLSTWDPAQDFNAGKFLARTQPLKGSNIKAQELVNASGNADLQLKEIYGQAKINVTHHAGGSMLAIPAMSEYPVQAMKFLNLMHVDSKLINMMLYGVEGTHWEVESDGRVNIINSAWYGAHAGAWTLGDTQIQAVSNKEDPEKNRMLIEYSNDSVAHPTLGFRFRTEPVAAELTAIQAVVDGMNRSLFTGSVDPDVEIPKYVDALKAAGMDKVMAEVQLQYDAWKQAKGE